MLPGSVESGVLLSPNDSVPPLWLDGLTTPVTAALKPVGPDVPPLPPPPLLLLLPPPQAASASVATAPSAASPVNPRLFIR